MRLTLWYLLRFQRQTAHLPQWRQQKEESEDSYLQDFFVLFLSLFSLFRFFNSFSLLWECRNAAVALVRTFVTCLS